MAVDMAANTPQEIWDRVKTRLRLELGEDVFSSWFARADLDAIDGGTVQISVPTRFLKSWIASHYQDRLIELWRMQDETALRVELRVRNAAFAVPSTDEKRAENEMMAARPDAVAATGTSGPATTALGHAAPRGGGAGGNGNREAEADDSLVGSPLDPRLTFESFCVGRSNELAAAAARRVAADREIAYNPLMLHAQVGLGKTHLLQAIAHEVQAGVANGQRPRRILYLTAERFMYRFVAALQSNSALAFKDLLRGIDMLLIDDVQFLQGRTMQAEFGHVLNALLDTGRQVVVAADRSPAKLDSLDERVRSRLAGGLTVELESLDLDLRRSIMSHKVDIARTRYPQLDIADEVTSYVASEINGSGRDLDGALTRLLAHNQLTNAPITVELASRTIRDLVNTSEPRKVKIEDIQKTVAKHFNVSRADLLSARRTRTVVRPRQIAMYLAKQLTPRSLPEIGRRFGGRDHTTVLHAVRKVESLMKDDTMIADDVTTLKRMLEG